MYIMCRARVRNPWIRGQLAYLNVRSQTSDSPSVLVLPNRNISFQIHFSFYCTLISSHLDGKPLSTCLDLALWATCVTALSPRPIVFRLSGPSPCFCTSVRPQLSFPVGVLIRLIAHKSIKSYTSSLSGPTWHFSQSSPVKRDLANAERT